MRRVRVYESLLKPILFAMDPERAHHLAISVLQLLSKLPRNLLPHAEGEGIEVFGVHFPNRVGLAAGFDKNAVALPAWEALGFGFVETGTITAQAQPGNPSPRIFRIPEQEALINRLGFNNDGAERIAARLNQLRSAGRWPRIPVGINIGKTKVAPLEQASADYLRSFRMLKNLGDYYVLNVSSPNTPGLRQLQERGAIEELFAAIQGENTGKPLLVKIAPDLTGEQIEDLIAIVKEYRLAGIIATNTTIDQSCLPESRRQEGGLSGRPLRTRALDILRFIRKLTDLPIISVGGIMSVDDAKERFDSGANLIQLYTGFIYRGPGLIWQIATLGRVR
jgi:dihydroorotate dehydrogenase